MRFNPGAMALTIFGWTPGLREIVAGRVLVCGCLVGVYEMWTGECVEILDGRCDNCGESRHEVNRVLQLAPPECAADMGGAPSQDHKALQTRPRHIDLAAQRCTKSGSTLSMITSTEEEHLNLQHTRRRQH